MRREVIALGPILLSTLAAAEFLVAAVVEVFRGGAVAFATPVTAEAVIVYVFGYLSVHRGSLTGVWPVLTLCEIRLI